MDSDGAMRVVICLQQAAAAGQLLREDAALSQFATTR